MKYYNQLTRGLLATVLFTFSLGGFAQTTYTVTNTNNSGAGSLRQAILDAEASLGADIINIPAGTITLSTGLPNITEDLTISGVGNGSTIIDGNSQIRPFFIGGYTPSSSESPVVSISDLTVQNGLAAGQDGPGVAGGGAGMGGGLFVNDGDITLTNVIFDSNNAIGGNGGNDRFGGGGDGGDGPFENTGGEAATTANGFIGYDGQFGAGGGGGIYYFNFGGANGGKGGYGAGGGGGGGHQSAFGIGGSGGTFGGNGATAISVGSAGGGGGAGLGGALYVRNGTIELQNISFQNNTATGGAGGNASPEPSGANGQGRGGAIFNDGGSVTATFFSFSGNTASTAGADTQGTVTFITDVAITVEPVDQLHIDEGMAAAFSVTATGTVEDYQWQVDVGNGFLDITDDANYSGATTAMLDLTCVPRSFHNYQYRVQIGGTLNEVTSQVATLTVTNAPDLLATIASNDLVVQCDGESLNFTSTVQNVNTTAVYQWLLNGSPVQGETSDSFTGAVNEGDEISLELSEPASCFPRPAVTSNVLTVQRIKVDTVVIANTLTGRTDVGSLPFHLAQLNSLPCQDIITVMDLRQLPNGAVISMDQALYAGSPVHVIGNGSDETTIQVSSRVFTAVLGDFNKIEGIKLEDVSGLDNSAIEITGDSLVMHDVIVTGFGFNNGEKGIEFENRGVNYYMDLDSVQLLGAGRPLDIRITKDYDNPELEVTGTIKIRNSVIKNGLYHAIVFDFDGVSFDEVLVQGNLLQDNDLAAMLVYFEDGVTGEGFTFENNSIINQFREGLSFQAIEGLDIDVVVRNNTFSETGVRANTQYGGGDFPAVQFEDVDAQVINNTMVGVQHVMSIGTNNQIIFANNLVLEEENGVAIYSGATPDYSGSGNNIGIDIGNNNDMTSTTLEVIQSLTLSDPGGIGLLVYEPVECGPAIGLANDTYAPAKDQLGALRIFPADIGAVEGTLSVDDFTVTVATDPFPFPGDITFTPTVTPVENSPTRTYTYEWFKNNNSSATTESFSTTGLVVGDEIEVRVTPNNDFCLRPGVAIETIPIREASSLLSTAISESVAVGEVATEIVPDPSLSAGATFSLVAGTGDTDNASFSIQGTDLLVASALDFESDPSLSIRLSVSDEGLTYEQVIHLTIIDINDAPEFTSSPTLFVERDAAYDYDISFSDDESALVSFEAVTVPEWLTLTETDPVPEAITVTTLQTGIPAYVYDFAVDEAGNYYYYQGETVYKRDAAGTETVIVDSNSPIVLDSPSGIDVAPDGTVYVVDEYGGTSGDGGVMAISGTDVSIVANIDYPLQIAVLDNNTFYVFAEGYKLIKVENGVQTVIAGTDNGSTTDGVFGVGEINSPRSMDIAPDGTVWFKDNNLIRKISTDGTITTVMADPATSDVTTAFSGTGLQVDPTGNVYFMRGGEVVKIPAGTNSFLNFIGAGLGSSVDGDQITARWGRLVNLYADKYGSIYTIGASTNSSSVPMEIRKISLAGPSYSLTGTASIAGEFPVSLRTSDGATTVDQDFTIEVRGPLRFEADPVTTAVEGAQYIYNPSAIHSQNTAFTYGFTLPDWLDTSPPFVPTSFLNISTVVPSTAPLKGAGATVTDEAVYTIQGSTISGIRFDGSMDITIDFSSFNPITSFEGPVITSNVNGELYFAFNVADPSFDDQDKLIKVDPNVSPVSFTDLGTFQNITDIDIYENQVIILEERIDNSMLVGDISIVDDAGTVTSVLTNSGAEGLNVSLDGKIYFVGGSNFQPDDHSEFIAELAVNGTISNTKTIFSDEEVYSVQDLVVDAAGNAYIHYESLDMGLNIYDSYFYFNGIGGSSLFTAPNDIGTFEITGFTRYGTTNDIFYIYNNIATGTSDLLAYADNQIVFGTPGATDGGVNPVVITLDDQSEVVTLAYDITVAFDNDAPTGLEISGNSIDENNATATSVLTFNTLDPDGSGDTFTYTLVAGTGDTDNAEFSIVDDGLQATISYDAEANPGDKSIRVRSTDAAGEFVEETFDITINEINEAPTDIALSGNMEVDENLETGTLVGILTTTDEDAGDNHTYALSGVGSDLFQVVGDELQTAQVLDFEQGASYTLTITVEDAGQLNHNEDFTITIMDDNPTDIQLSNSSVDEGLLPGAIVGTFSTVDDDPQHIFTYEFVNGTNFNAFFEIEGDILKTKGIFDASQFTSVTIRVSTTDEIGESFEKDLVITINDLTNSAPQLLNAPATTATQGQLYTFGLGGFDFDGDDLTYTGSGSDWLTQQDQPAVVEEFLSQNGTQKIEIDDDDNLYMTILGASGFATNILKYDDDNETTSMLLASDATSVTFVDIDENGVVYFSDNNFQGPVFELKKIENGTVSNVHFANGDILTGSYHPDGYLVFVEDQGDGTKDIIRVDLDGMNRQTLELDVGFATVFEVGEDENIYYASSTTIHAIDIEGDEQTGISLQTPTSSANPPFLFFISDFVQYTSDESYVLFGLNDGNGGQTEVLVRITPSGEEELWRGSVPNEASDIAANAKSEVYFTRDSDSDGVNAIAVYNAAFTFFFGTPGDEHVGPSNFDLNVSDGSLSNDYSFVIDVQNVNDAPIGIALSTTSFSENNNIGVSLATITSEDPDNDSGDTHTYALVSGEGDTDNGSFEIAGNDLKALTSFDHEDNATRNIRIRATDASNSTFEQTLSLNVVDLNESPTAIQLSSSTINENEVAGTVIGTLSTVDPDANNNNLVFEIIEGAENFQLSGAELQSAASFDFETNVSLTVKVRASDGVENTATFFTIEETFTITIGDVSESPSDIAISNASIAENADSGTVIGTLTAQDPDGSNTNTFSLVENSEDNAFFSISGDLLVSADVFNFEVKTSYTVDVQVNDGGGNTFTEKITITINDVNEAPVFISASTASIAENTTTVATLVATDVDENATLTYSIVDGADKDLFSLSGAVLSFVAAPDFEGSIDADGDNDYEVTVSVSDGTNHTDHTMTITVTDANESPVFSTSGMISVTENSTNVTSLTAADPDAGATLTYSISGGTDEATFSLSGSDLAFVSAPDFESPIAPDNNYELTVSVSDGTNSTDLPMTISVGDVNESPTSISLSNLMIEETVPESTVVGVFSSTDADISFEHSFNFIEGDNDNSSFEISENKLITSSSFDFETKSLYKIDVIVTDKGGLTLEKEFEIEILDVDEENQIISSIIIDPIEDQFIGNSEITLTATTNPESAVVIWSIFEGSGEINENVLTLGSESGTISVIGLIEETRDHTKSSDTVEFQLLDPTLVTPEISFNLPDTIFQYVQFDIGSVLNVDLKGATTVSTDDIKYEIQNGDQANGLFVFPEPGMAIITAKLEATSQTNATSHSDTTYVKQIFLVSGYIEGPDWESDLTFPATVTAYDPSNPNFLFFYEVTFDDFGFYTLGLPEGSYYIFAEHDDFLITFYGDVAPALSPDATIPKLVVTSDLTVESIILVSVPSSGVQLLPDTEGGKIYFQARSVLSGSSRFVQGRVADGEVLPNTMVILYSSAGEYVADALTDEEGNVVFEGLPDGDYVLAVDIPGVGRVTTEIPVEGESEFEVTALISEEGISLGVEEILSLSETVELEIYPNPIDRTFILLLDNDYHGPVQVKISDIQGKVKSKVILSKNINHFKSELELYGASGIYLLEVTYPNKTIIKRLIKN